MAQRRGQPLSYEDLEKLCVAILEEMNNFIALENVAAELRFHVEDCRTKLLRAWERFLAFAQEIKSVCYHGNIGSVHSFAAKLSAFCGCDGLSRSYAGNVRKAIKRARQQFSHFKTACDEINLACEIKIVDASDKEANSGSMSLIAGAAACGIVVASCFGLPVGFLARAVVVGSGLVSAVGAVRFRLQAREFNQIKGMFKDIYKVSSRLREVGSDLMEKLGVVEQLTLFLTERRISGYYVHRALNGIYGRLKSIEERVEDVTSQLQDRVAAQAT